LRQWRVRSCDVVYSDLRIVDWSRTIVFFSNRHVEKKLQPFVNPSRMSTKIPYPFPYGREIQECRAAALNFDASLRKVKAASDVELAQMADAGAMEELENWLGVAEGVKVSRHRIKDEPGLIFWSLRLRWRR
jgi:hypothetical protein